MKPYSLGLYAFLKMINSMDLALSCQGLTLLSWQNYKKLLRTFEAAVTSHEISVTRLLTAASLYL